MTGEQQKPLAGRVAIVTGSSRGIGKDIAGAFAAAGAAVVIGARSEETRSDPRLPGTIHEVAAAIESAGGQALPLRLEMREIESIEDCVSATVERFGRIDIVVNNAAAFVGHLLERIEPRHVDLMTQVNVRG
ncbi:MAG: SDR family NAD(P)-dependent oxidoreductase, partial [Gammaproteobacteria bacterium]|nr:SDR family NAD(P)-dependent oxidoreductase [Gammaproteobacteria bacterium]